MRDAATIEAKDVAPQRRVPWASMQLPREGCQGLAVGGMVPDSASAGSSAARDEDATCSMPAEHHVDTQLARAEELWKQGMVREAVRCYEAVLEAARLRGDTQREGMVCLGLGYALLNTGENADLAASVAAISRCKALAVSHGHDAQAQYASTMLEHAAQRERLYQRALQATTCYFRGAHDSLEQRNLLTGEGGEQDPTHVSAGDLVLLASSGRGRGMPQRLGTAECFMPDRGRWAVRLPDGTCCAATPAQIERAPFRPFQRVEITDPACGLTMGMRGEIVGCNPSDSARCSYIYCWAIELDTGHSTTARAQQIRPTQQAKLARNLQELQALAWATGSLTLGSPVFAMSLDLVEMVAAGLGNPSLAVWARFLCPCAHTST